MAKRVWPASRPGAGVYRAPTAMDAKGQSGLGLLFRYTMVSESLDLLVAWCHRLKRPCQTADTLRRRSDKKQNSSDARIAILEGTLGQLVSLLHANNVHVGDRPNIPPQEQEQEQSRPDPATIGHHSPLIPTPSSSSCHDDTAEETEGNGRRIIDDATFGDEDVDDRDNDAMDASWWARDSENFHIANSIHLASPRPSTMSWATVSKASMPLSSASTSLDAFRRHKLHHCPFVHLPAQLTVEQLRQDRPFLFRAIVCVESSSIVEKRTRALELKRVLFETVFLQQSSQQPHQLRRKLDLLLGLLIYIAWGWDHIHSGGSLSRLMMVAASLAGEMCLDKVVPEPTIGLFDPKGFEDWHGGTTTGTELTDAQFLLERQRAVLGCFVLGSAVSAYFSQVDAPRWSPQMEECLSAISISSTNTEYMSDGTLGFQVRLQLLAMKAAQTCKRCQLPDQPPVATLPGPALLYIKTLMVQLQDLRASIPPAFQHNVFPLAHTYYTDLCIIETVHAHEIANAPPTSGPTRLWYFWQVALAIKSCTSTFLTLTPSEFLGVSFIQWAQLARCIATLHNLRALSELGWDLTAVRRLVDLPSLLACTAEKLELASAEAGEQSSDGVFAQLARGMRIFQSTYSENDRGAFLAQQGEAQAGAGADADAIMHAQQEEYLSNPTLWLDRFLIDHDEQTVLAS
ncbi:hypothetical protein MMC18_004269 [Xylographa bjoerkii]|nr:hypothetical protein [Xylographa bjoerkii]